MTDIPALETRVTRIEDQIAAGFSRIESLLRSEINDLKTEQITDLREANKRLADDQRRLWEHVGQIELRDGQRTGSSRAFERMWNFGAALIGGGIAIAGSWLSSRVPPP